FIIFIIMTFICDECKSKGKFSYYCQNCNSVHWLDNFKNWTCGNQKIDKLIQESQFNAQVDNKLVEYIQYSNLEKIQYLAKGGFGIVYKAIWKDGPIKPKVETRYDENGDILYCNKFWMDEKSN